MDAFPIHQSLSSFLLIVLLFFTPASSDQEYEQRFLNCLRMPTTFDCGGAQLPIYFPFWTENSPENCRFPYENEIKCIRTDNSSEIVIQKRPYHVIEIDYVAQKATIVDKDYYLANEGKIPCHAPSNNANLDFSLFNYTQRDLNLSFLYNCSYPLPQNNQYLKFPISCPSDDLRDHAYFTFEEHITDPSINCQVIQIPIHRTNKDLLWLNPEEFRIVNVLAGGFEVTWSFTKLDHLCWDCFKSNGLCRSNETSYSQRDCYCNGRSFPEECPVHTEQSSTSDSSIQLVSLSVSHTWANTDHREPVDVNLFCLCLPLDFPRDRMKFLNAPTGL